MQRVTEEQLRQSQKDGSHRRGIADDFKYVLTAIVGHLEMAESHLRLCRSCKERFARQNATSCRPSILLAFARCQPALRPQTGRHSLRNWRRREDPQPGQSVSKSGWVICDEETKVDLWLHSSNGDPATFTDMPTERSITELS